MPTARTSRRNLPAGTAALALAAAVLGPVRPAGADGDGRKDHAWQPPGYVLGSGVADPGGSPVSPLHALSTVAGTPPVAPTVQTPTTTPTTTPTAPEQPKKPSYDLFCLNLVGAACTWVDYCGDVSDASGGLGPTVVMFQNLATYRPLNVKCDVLMPAGSTPCVTF